MTDIKELRRFFSSGELVKPGSEPGLTELMASVAELIEVDTPVTTRRAIDLGPAADHVIFVLADGLGLEILNRYAPDGGWLKCHLKHDLLTVFPSTTPAGITTVASAVPPIAHGINGWWVWLNSVNAPVTVFHNELARTREPLTEFYEAEQELYSWKSIFQASTKNISYVLPSDIVNSRFSHHAFPNGQRIGYDHIKEVPQLIREIVTRARVNGFTYFYTTHPDSISHKKGLSHEVEDSIIELDEQLEQIQSNLKSLGVNYKIILTADHGHLEIDPHLSLDTGSDLTHLLREPPFGDMRVHYWKVISGAEQTFVSLFRALYGEWFFIISSGEAIEMELFGSEGSTVTSHFDIGDFVSIAKGSAALRFSGFPGHRSFFKMKSHHSGLTPSEMKIPLVIADTQ
ncbi:MAG: alkaline phosphatase family protein [Chloroflexota bacterium]|nr:alkaline phosphatase family protein [Chloroflexota bacterium]